VERRRITEFLLQSLKRKEKKYDVPDELRGLFVRVLPSGTKTFYFTYSLRGRNRFYRIGPVIIGLKAARRETVQLIARVARGEDPQAERRAQRSAGTFKQLHQRYLEEHARRYNKSWRQAERLIRVYVLKRLGNLSAEQVIRADVRALFNSLSDTPNQANKVKDAVSAVYTWAMSQDIITVNPAQGIASNPTGSRERVLSNSEVPMFWKACDEIDPVRSRALKVVLLTGQRPGEVAHMRREHIRDGTSWEMPGKPVAALGWPGTKNGKSHRVQLCAKVMELIGEGDSGFVFVSTRGNAIDDLDAAMRMISQRLDSPPATPHDLRRTFGSRVTGRGHGREAMDRILNHSRRVVADVYDRHDYAERDRHVMEDVANSFVAQVEGRTASNVVLGDFQKAVLP
jgi:integrase